MIRLYSLEQLPGSKHRIDCCCLSEGTQLCSICFRGFISITLLISTRLPLKKTGFSWSAGSESFGRSQER